MGVVSMRIIRLFFMFIITIASIFFMLGCIGTVSTPIPTESTPTPTEPIETVPTIAYANGIYDFKFADADLRHHLFAHAERYLLQTMAGGVPLFANAGFAMFSSRMELTSDQYVPVLGFGINVSTMSEDDSTVLMDDGQSGQAGEYTLRTAINQDPSTLHQWAYTDATSAEIIGLFINTLYAFGFNDDKTGFVVEPSMAAQQPEPLNPETLESGKIVAKTWRIPIRQDLKWTYHDDTDTGGFPEGHEHINAHSFVNTYRFAIEQGWYRAGHFVSSSVGILNAQRYYNWIRGTHHAIETSWDDVGIKAIDDYTIEFTFANDMSAWNILYWLSSIVLTPVNFHIIDLYGVDQYGTSPEKIAYTGPYTLDVWESGKVIRYSKNENYTHKNLIFYTGRQITIIDDAEVRFQAFLANKLDVASVPTAQFESVRHHPGLKRFPGPTTFRLAINAFGTKEALQAQFPNTDYDPKPILANLNFRRAMYFAIDRQFLAEEVLLTSQAQMYLFTESYLVDTEGGIPFRLTPQSVIVSEGLSPDTHGFDFDAARSLYLQALDELIAEGKYAPGTAENPTVIELSLYIFEGSTGQELLGQYLKEAFELAFMDLERHIKVQLIPTPKSFPGIYFDYVMIANFDLAVGGISGATLDAAGFLNTFTSDNRSGFTMSWGIDTSVPDIAITYTNFAGETVTELWSYDALQSALNGSTRVVDGREVPFDED
jgi:ABC-type oligopeptide transport system substrate-binding subunit